MTDRSPKLSTMELLVIWGCPFLTLGEMVVCYHDWTLDQEGPDGSYLSHASMSARLGGKLTPASVSTIRQRLKRLGLHEALRRTDARNLGWVTTLPGDREFRPRTFREVPGLGFALGKHLERLDAWSKQSGSTLPDKMEVAFQVEWIPDTASGAVALGGRGESPSLPSMRETQLPTAVSHTAEKGVGALAPKEKRGEAAVREEWEALEKLRKGQPLTNRERQVVRAYTDRKNAEADERKRAAAS